MKRKKPAYSSLQNVGYMVRYAWANEKSVLGLCVLEALTAVALSLVKLYVTPVVLGQVGKHVPLSALCLWILLFTLLMIVLSAFQKYLETNDMYGRITLRSFLINELNEKGAVTSYPNTEDKAFTDLSEKASEAVCSNSAATEAVWKTLVALGQNGLGFLVYLALLTNVSPLLMALVLVLSIAGYLFGKKLNSYGYRHRDEEAAFEKRMTYVDKTARDPAAAKDIRIFGVRPWLNDVYQKTMNAYTAFQLKAERVYIWANILDLLLAFLRNGAAYYYLLTLTLQNNLSAAEFLLYFSAVGGFTQWVTGILDNMTTLHRQSLDLCNVREFLTFPEPFRFDDGETLTAKPDAPYEITFSDVSFRYPGAEKDTITHLSLSLHPGERLAIVGLNGAGKTTLVKLLCGLYDPTSGAVLLNGQDIRTYNRRDYYTLFSSVFQTFCVLAGSVKTNVCQTETGPDDERMWDCIEKAGLTEKVKSLPQQENTLLERQVYEDAVMLSGGETQRLMLARALYKNAPIILLDEPTAALDPIAEADLYQKYSDMTKGKSSVYISHRLASTRFCDRIILLGDGVIVEEGTHDNLLAKGGKYAELFEIQSKYYRKEENENG